MGKIGRFACIFTPMALTIASAICLILVVIGQVGNNGKAPSTSTGRDLYFFKADTSGFTADPKNILDHLPKDVKVDNDLLKALQGAASSKDLKDFYQVGLWSYCEGDKVDGVEKITFCSEAKHDFWFDPFAVWELKDTSAQKALGEDLQKGLDTYKKVAGWMNWSFIIAICLSAAEFILGFFAIFSRWGSFVTTIVSTAQTLFVIAAATTATATYSVLAGVFETVLKPYNIKAGLGNKMLSTLWLGVAFAIVSGIIWLFSTCCCSGKSSNPKKGTIVEKSPYTYERVASPAFGGAGAHTSYGGPAGHGTSGTSYEPFRQSHA